ncbi:MAG TPA: LCP family protein [Candidatus Omnitrophota bacterium]|nr:LCP family protein [Candidatus Omnitrophota bacterium]
MDDKEFLKRIYEADAANKAPAGNDRTVAPPKRSGKRPIVLVGISLVLLVFFSAMLGFILALFSRFLIFETILTLLPGEKFLAETNILVMGLDQGDTIHRSDSIMVLHLDPARGEANVVSIPRDTIVSIPGRGLDKINHAYAFGGADLARSTVENFLGVKIPYYLTVDTAALAKLIDEIGGVTIDVEKRLYYIDHSQDLFIDLQPGVQKLDGRNAVAYLRYRHDDGDLSRILRQQKFIQALASQIMNKQNLIRSPQIILQMCSYLETNLNTREILGLAINMRKIIEFGQIHMSTLAGSDMMVNGVYYMKPDYEKVRQVVSEYFKGST